MGTQNISLSTGIDARDATLTTDALLSNGYSEQGKDSIVRAVKRSGLGSGVTYAAGNAQGLVNYFGTLLVVVNNSVYTSPTQSFPISASSLRVDFA